MARPKGSKNKARPVPYPMNLSTEERIQLLASIILDTIEEEQRNGSKPPTTDSTEPKPAVT